MPLSKDFREGMTGYLRDDGRKGVRNLVAVMAAADNVTARGELVSALGEGFADSLDVVGF